MTINISIVDKRPTVIGAPVIVCGNSDYVIQFSFDAEWDAEGAKIARFVYVQRGAIKYQDVDFTGTTVTAPILSGIREVMVGVYAGNLRTTTPALIPCEKSILCDSGEEQIGVVDKAELEDQIGDLDELKTTDKNNLVDAINWLFENGVGKGGGGSTGGLFTPHVSDDGVLSWTNDQGLPNPDPVNIRGPQGPKGADGTMSFEDLTDEQRESLRGPEGPAGPQGEPGPAGKGIDYVVEQHSNFGGRSQTTLTINYTDGTSSTITVADGVDGVDGVDGAAGTAVYTFDPDQALGWNGADSLDPSFVNLPEGVSLKVGDLLLAPNGDVYIIGETYAASAHIFTATLLFSIRGPEGPKGADGTMSFEDLTEEQRETLRGPAGDPGPAGEAGHTPERGVDYWTEDDVAEIKAYVDEAILGGKW